MKNKFKNIDWKEVGWRFLKLLAFLILNTPTITFLIGNFVPYGTIQDLRISWIDYLRLSKQVEWYSIYILYIAMGITLAITFYLLKWLIEQKKAEKRTQEVIKQNEINTSKIVEAIQKKELDKKEEKNVSKYL